ncbi:hypothetical protein MTQ10_03700 [Streptomyces sp. XM83C]|uniref:Uncharacterized protein n=1 Tax=Streptomyces thermocoprophilus TaxID=78356 RepID=A0ABV5VL28_9ACTN|nr:hypothetical protein [Streptomyces sp. XM83C]MCK1818730.1 hypothetical protein [Streptomyces sp. XM83C]
MSSARRPLLTATAAATLLGALWFVPSANATQENGAREQTPMTTTAQARAVPLAAADTAATEADSAVGAALHASADGTEDVRLADTGSFDSTPYVVGGTLFLAVGAGFVVYSVRRERLEF